MPAMAYNAENEDCKMIENAQQKNVLFFYCLDCDIAFYDTGNSPVHEDCDCIEISSGEYTDLLAEQEAAYDYDDDDAESYAYAHCRHEDYPCCGC